MLEEHHPQCAARAPGCRLSRLLESEVFGTVGGMQKLLGTVPADPFQTVDHRIRRATVAGEGVSTLLRRNRRDFNHASLANVGGQVSARRFQPPAAETASGWKCDCLDSATAPSCGTAARGCGIGSRSGPLGGVAARSCRLGRSRRPEPAPPKRSPQCTSRPRKITLAPRWSAPGLAGSLTPGPEAGKNQNSRRAVRQRWLEPGNGAEGATWKRSLPGTNSSGRPWA